MEQLTTGILRRSSDAVVIVSLADGKVIDANEAFFAMTGHTRRELVGRPGRELLVGLGEADPTVVEVLQQLRSITDVPVGLFTRSGELRVGDLSALVLAVEGQRDALCTFREVRDPTPGQRRSVARTELDDLVRVGDTWPAAAHRALQTFGGCLRWEFGALWQSAPSLENLRCVSTWRSPWSHPGPLEEAAARYATFPSPGMEALRRVRLQGKPTWIPDASADPELSRAQIVVGEPIRGWLAFPALGSDGIIGVVEFVSHETRQPDPKLLEMIENFGRLFGRLLEDVEAPDHGPVEETGTRAPSSGTEPDAFRDLASAVTAASEALERHPTLPRLEPSASLSELTAGLGKLNRLLEDAIQNSPDGPPTLASPARSTEATAALPTGLTLKAVSRRTGIPAATLRTWEHRYGFMRPRRSHSGHRLYGEAEIARIEKVKYLVAQGVRISAAMQAVIEQTAGGELADESRQSG